MTQAMAPERRFEIGTVIKETFALWRANPAVISVLTVIFSVLPAVIYAWFARDNEPVDALSALQGAPGETVVTNLLGMLLGLTLIQVASAQWQGRRMRVRGAISGAGEYFLPGLGLTFLTGLGVIVGMLFLIVPGVFLLVTWSVVLPVLVLENKGVLASISRSAELTRFCRGAILALILLLLLLLAGVMLIYFLVTLIGTLVLPDSDTTILTDVILMPLLGGGFTTITVLGSIALYRELKRVKEGGELSEVADVFA